MTLKLQNYVNLFLSVKEELYDYVFDFLSDYPFTGIEEKIDELIVTFPANFLDDSKKSEIMSKLQSISSEIQITKAEIITDKNWNEEWEKNIKPVIINERICICPEWRVDEVQSQIKIIINPKMSFGTGSHETTRLMCNLLEKVVKPNSKWIDVGTGTGILSILAIKLGASKVMAFDNNFWAYENSKENVILNNVQREVEVLESDVNTFNYSDVDGIVANLYTYLIIPSFPKFFKSLIKSNGDLLVSGILKYDATEVIDAAKKAGFKLVEQLFENEWVAFHFNVGE